VGLQAKPVETGDPLIRDEGWKTINRFQPTESPSPLLEIGCSSRNTCTASMVNVWDSPFVVSITLLALIAVIGIGASTLLLRRPRSF